jgi:site-specific recombinase XerD
MPSLFKRDNGFYYFTAKINGKKKWVSLLTKSRTLARERYAEKADQHERGLLDLKARKPVPTLQALFDEYLPFCKNNNKPRTYRDTECHIRLFLSSYFGHLRATDLEPKHIEEFKGKLLNFIDPETGMPAPYHPRTINLRLETLRKILRRAVENKKSSGLQEMPCKIKMLKEPESLPRYAYPDQIKDWMGYLDIAHRMRAILSLMTGITDRDLGYVLLDGYDRHNALLRFRRPKTTTDIVVPLTKTAIQILDFLVKDNPGPELFPAASAKRAFYEASKKATEAGGKNITPHMLRHTFGTWLLSMGVPLSHLKAIYGHKDIKTTERYAKVMPEYLRASLANLESKEFDIQALLDLPRKNDGRTKGKRRGSKRVADDKRPIK